GTAVGAFAGFPSAAFPVAGKTGTAQAGNKQDTSLFMSFAPAEDPQFVIGVVMEEAGFGASAAAPVARRILETLAGHPPRPVSYRVFRDVAPVIYLGTFGLPILVLSPLGSSTRGAQAWFQFGTFQFEPSEWAKLALIVCVGAYCATHRGDLDGRRLLSVMGLA